jgi:LytS/YehU family sensor histidine kinase
LLHGTDHYSPLSPFYQAKRLAETFIEISGTENSCRLHLRSNRLDVHKTLVSIWVFQSFTFSEIKPGIAFVTTFNWSATLLIWSLIYFGFHYVESTRKTEVEKWKLEVAVKEAELRALKSQMNPHFIFNCLNNIRGLIVEDPERAQTVVTQLASILRYSLQAGDTETVTLEEELQTVSDYLALEAVRLEERLQVKMDIDPPR